MGQGNAGREVAIPVLGPSTGAPVFWNPRARGKERASRSTLPIQPSLTASAAVPPSRRLPG